MLCIFEEIRLPHYWGRETSLVMMSSSPPPNSNYSSLDVLRIEDVNALPLLQCIEVPLLTKSNNPEVLFKTMGGREKTLKALAEGKAEHLHIKMCTQGLSVCVCVCVCVLGGG